MGNRILALEDAYRILVLADSNTFSVISDKIRRIKKYIDQQIQEEVTKLGAE